jgi:hypothetical protein
MHCVGAVDVAGDGFSKSVGVECEVNLERKSLIRSLADLGTALWSSGFANVERYQIPFLGGALEGHPLARALVLGAYPCMYY